MEQRQQVLYQHHVPRLHFILVNILPGVFFVSGKFDVDDPPTIDLRQKLMYLNNMIDICAGPQPHVSIVPIGTELAYRRCNTAACTLYPTARAFVPA